MVLFVLSAGGRGSFAASVRVCFGRCCYYSMGNRIWFGWFLCIFHSYPTGWGQERRSFRKLPSAIPICHRGERLRDREEFPKAAQCDTYLPQRTRGCVIEQSFQKFPSAIPTCHRGREVSWSSRVSKSCPVRYLHATEDERLHDR